MTEFFSLPGLGSIQHTDQTRQILDRKDNKSEFLREAIMNFAKVHGYLSNSHMPESAKERLAYLQEKSYYVDYEYIAAFWWLQTLADYQFYSKSELVRIIICDQQDQ